MQQKLFKGGNYKWKYGIWLSKCNIFTFLMVRQLKIVNANIGPINLNTKLGIKINSFSIVQLKCRLLTNQNTGRLIIVESTPITPMAWYYIVIRVVEFSSVGYKIRKNKKELTYHRKSLNFENWCNGEVSKSDKIWLSKSIF